MGVLAYLMWGAFPLYWPLLKPAGAIEILSHRIAWSALIVGVLVLVLRQTPRVRAVWRNRRQSVYLALAAAVISVNWVTYIWGVNHGRVVEGSLGYFINPLVTVLLGVLVLGERLRRGQWFAMGIAAVAVAVLTVDYGHVPWVAVGLALTFGTYGLCKKQADAAPLESLAVETALLAPFALAYVGFLVATGASSFGHEGGLHTALMVGTGVVTVIPLLLFSGAATSLPLVQLGLLQYLAPILQFAIGVFVFREEMSAARWLGFAIVWVALAIFTVEAARHRRRQLSAAAEASAI